MENFDILIEEMGQATPEYPEMPQGGELSQEQKDAFAARMKADRDTLAELAMTTEMEITSDGGTFQQYLDTLGRFDRYSTQNTLLIFAQYPGAVKLADYESWKAAGTPVTRGGNGIRIFEPGKEFLKTDNTIGTSMNIKHVFDISQTSARNKYQPETPRDIHTLLKALMNKSPAPIKLVDSLSEGNGARYNEQTGVIEVVRGLDGDGLFRCLAQEIAYAELDRQDPNGLTCQDKGFAAYAASYALCVKNGIDGRGYDFAGAPDYFAGMEGKKIRGEMHSIRDAVNVVATRMAKTLEPPQRETNHRETHRREARRQEVRA